MTDITTRPQGELGMSEMELLDVLQASIYPGAARPSIKLAVSYCSANSLDIFQKPVHIVPMWDKNSKSMRDVIMPGVGLYRTQAARSGALAGISEPEFGPSVDVVLDGAKFNVPEWCRVTVKRIVSSGAVADFSAIEYWIENYATAGKDSQAPNAMWKKRPRGQLAKCAQAQALRIAFPEMVSAAPTADEMEGKPLAYSEVDITPDKNARPARKNATTIASAATAPAVEMDQEQLDSLIADLAAVADNGRDALVAAWEAMSADVRRQVKPHMTALGKRADAVPIVDGVIHE